jgi:hypothetical protein
MASRNGSAIGAEARASFEGFHWNEAEYEKLLKGPVVADLVRRAIRVQAAARTGWSAPPSMPGGKPAVRTGLLRGSIAWRIGADAISPFVDVGTAVQYGIFVEIGTKNMAARPFLVPALEAARVAF